MNSFDDTPARDADLPVQVGVYVNDSPATDAEALAAFAALGWQVAGADDTQNGIWLVGPDPDFRERLDRDGFAEAHSLSCDIRAEMP